MLRSITRAESVASVVGRASRLKKTAGDLAAGIHFFDIVHGEGEEILIFHRLFAHGGGNKHGGVTIADIHAAVGLFCHATGFHIEGATAKVKLALNDVEVMH